MKYIFTILFVIQLLCPSAHAQQSKDSIYFEKINSPNTKMIPVYGGKYKVFTQRHGDGRTPLLLLHGGPENTHEYFENFPEHLKGMGLSIYFYDQLGSYYSDTPDDATIWNIYRFVEEVEEVRKGLGLKEFYLLGHSWGGMLAELYAAKYGKYVKGLILSNVPGFVAEDSKYLAHLMDSVDRAVRTQTALLPAFAQYRAQTDSISRGLPIADTLLARQLTRMFNQKNDSLFGRTLFYRKAGSMPAPMIRNSMHMRFQSLEQYHFDPFAADYQQALASITCPTLLIAGRYDFIQPEKYHALKTRMKAAVRVVIGAEGAHFNMWDDTDNYFKALRQFISDVEKGKFRADR